MPFWKKSEDPWDYEPEKPSRPAEPGPEEKDCAPSLMDELRDWNEERKEKKRQRQTPPPPMACQPIARSGKLLYALTHRLRQFMVGIVKQKSSWRLKVTIAAVQLHGH